jgi:anoctamin-10
MDRSSPFGDDFLELAMTFAMVTLFAGAFPLGAALALASNGLEGRMDAFKFLRCRQRPLPHTSASAVGVWSWILQVGSALCGCGRRWRAADDGS